MPSLREPSLARAFTAAAHSAHEREQLHQSIRDRRYSAQHGSGSVNRFHAIPPLAIQLRPVSRPSSGAAVRDAAAPLVARMLSRDRETVAAASVVAAPSAASPANSEHYRFTAALQAERLALESENQKLRRRICELESSLQLMSASQGANAWLVKSSAAANSQPQPLPTAKVDGPGPKLRPKPPSTRQSSSVSSATPVQRQILAAVEASQQELRAAPLPELAEQAVTASWNAPAWIASLRVCHILSEALVLPLGRAVSSKGGGSSSSGGAGGNGGDDGAGANSGGDSSSRLQLAYVRALSRCASREAIRELMCTPALLDALTSEIWRGVKHLAEAEGATSEELHHKFTHDFTDVFTLDFGSAQRPGGRVLSASLTTWVTLPTTPSEWLFHSLSAQPVCRTASRCSLQASPTSAAASTPSSAPPRHSCGRPWHASTANATTRTRRLSRPTTASTRRRTSSSFSSRPRTVAWRGLRRRSWSPPSDASPRRSRASCHSSGGSISGCVRSRSRRGLTRSSSPLASTRGPCTSSTTRRVPWRARARQPPPGGRRRNGYAISLTG